MQEKELQLSSWLVTARPFFRKGGVVLFIALDAGILLLLLLQGILFIAQTSRHHALVASFAENRVSYTTINTRNQPLPLVVSQSALLSGSEGTFDLVAIVRNPSARWAVESVTYTFFLDDQELAHGTTSFLPNEERYLAQFRVAIPRVSPNAKPDVRFSEIQWRRVVSASELPDVALETNDASYRILSSVPGDSLSQVAGTVINRSVLPVSEVEVTAILINATTIVGVGRLTIADMQPLEERPVDIRLRQSLVVSSVLLKATVDLASYPFDEREE